MLINHVYSVSDGKLAWTGDVVGGFHEVNQGTSQFGRVAGLHSANVRASAWICVRAVQSSKVVIQRRSLAGTRIQ